MTKKDEFEQITLYHLYFDKGEPFMEAMPLLEVYRGYGFIFFLRDKEIIVVKESSLNVPAVDSNIFYLYSTGQSDPKDMLVNYALNYFKEQIAENGDKYKKLENCELHKL